MNYEEVLAFLYEQLPMYQRDGAKALKPDLSNTIALVKLLGNPHKDFKSIHIAGTNGKGTTAHALASIMQEAGYKVGLYTSPHLKSYRERIRINGEEVEEGFVTDFVNDHLEKIKEISPSFFEITVAMAFSYFSKQKVDLAIIETGLGGRLDSTNIIEPIVSVITSIGRDHEDLLGNTLESIAFEKAGIIKKGKPVVVGIILSGPLKIIQEQAQHNNAQLTQASDNWNVLVNDSGSVDIERQGEEFLSKINVSLKGSYFLKNLPTVLETLTHVQRQFNITDDHIIKGLSKIQRNTGLKGRWQVLSNDPLTICDIGHNEDGISEIVSQLDKLEYERLHFVFGTVEDKSLENILSLLKREATYYFCAANVPRALPVDELYAVATSYGLKGNKYDSVSSASESAIASAASNDLVFIGGSTFVVAEVENL
ncbi:MAG: bifunctional folylpolyglutamate synthase/dihydrofolate synthase [Cyclobacteriaceae bacterium]